MKKLCLIYSNCQGDGLAHFLKKTPMADDYEFKVYHNWRLMLNEEEVAPQLLRDAHEADVFIFQPCKGYECRDGTKVPATDVLGKVDQLRISFPYSFNHGFFPFVKLGAGWGGWATSDEAKTVAKSATDDFKTRQAVILYYGEDSIHYDCAGRFLRCLAEQARREQETDIHLVPWILQNFSKQKLFLTYNHPTSALFEELAKAVLWHIGVKSTFPGRRPVPARIEWTDENEAGMNGMQPVHPAVVRELGLEYPPTDNSIEYFRGIFGCMMNDLK